MIEQFFNPLTSEQKENLRKRMEKHRDRLEDQGFDVSFAEEENNLFAFVLVEDPRTGRKGVLEEDGTVNWMGAGKDVNVGEFGSGVVQNQSEQLEEFMDQENIADRPDELPGDVDTG